MGEDVRRLTEADAPEVYAVINAAAGDYRGVIPEAADTTPYMAMAELEAAFGEMAFHGVDRDGLAGVIGVQERDAVSLIRHLYVRPDVQRQGLGSALLEAGLDRADADRVLVGTWAAADWAIDFYESHGFRHLGADAELLATHWDVPDHQLEASVVLEYEGG